MDIAKAMASLTESNPDAAKVIQEQLTSLSTEAGDNRKNASKAKQQAEASNLILSTIAQSLGVKDVDKIPEKVSTTTNELQAIIDARKEDRTLIDTLMKESEDNKKIMGRTSIKDKLKDKFKDFKDPEYHADLYADRAKQGETGLLIGDKFVDDVVKNLAVDKPYLLSKEIKKEVKTDSDGNSTPIDTKVFTVEDIKSMSPEEREENRSAIISQATEEG